MMAVWSRVMFSEAKREDRFGAEFWRPEYLEPLTKDRNWHLIGDLLTTVQYGISREMNEDGIGEPIFRMNEMEDLFLSSPAKCVVLEKGEYAEFSLSLGDVLFNRTNSLKYVGRTGILKEPLSAVFASYLIRLVPDTEKLLPEYLTVYLNSPTGIDQVKRRAMESINQSNVSGSEIRKVPIPLMPLSFQRSVAKLVDTAARKRLEARKLYDGAEELLLLKLGLGDLDLVPTLFYERNFSETQRSARLDAEYFHPKYDRIIKTIKKNPGAWGTLDDLCVLIGHPSNPPYANTEDANKTFIVTQKHLGSFCLSDDFWNDDDALYTTGEFAKTHSQYLLRKGDVILYSVGAYIGKANIYTDNTRATIGSFLTLLRTKKGMLNPYCLMAFLNTSIGTAISKRHQRGMAQQYLYPYDIKTFPIPVLPEGTQSEIQKMILDAIAARDESRRLLEEAIALVEKAILGTS